MKSRPKAEKQGNYYSRLLFCFMAHCFPPAATSDLQSRSKPSQRKNTLQATNKSQVKEPEAASIRRDKTKQNVPGTRKAKAGAAAPLAFFCVCKSAFFRMLTPGHLCRLP